jgi:hypothetical protein
MLTVNSPLPRAPWPLNICGEREGNSAVALNRNFRPITKYVLSGGPTPGRILVSDESVKSSSQTTGSGIYPLCGSTPVQSSHKTIYSRQFFHYFSVKRISLEQYGGFYQCPFNYLLAFLTFTFPIVFGAKACWRSIPSPCKPTATSTYKTFPKIQEYTDPMSKTSLTACPVHLRVVPFGRRAFIPRP